MFKILDVSNSSKRPPPRGVGGPVENDIVRYLKKYAHRFNASFDCTEANADVIFTNDVFPTKFSAPKVKRMDGVYSQAHLLPRNDSLNASALLADHVIFISEFSKQSLSSVYPEIILKSSSVCLNRADPNEFFKIKNSFKSFDFISTANDWARPEKRANTIIELAHAFPLIKFALIGSASKNAPENVEYLGYLDTYCKLNVALNQSKNFIYLGFNDPAPKTVCQAMNCGLPLLLTNSGGNFELAQNGAFYVQDRFCTPTVVKEVPDLDGLEVANKFVEFLKQPPVDNFFDSKEKFEQMLEQYFNIFKSYVV